MALYLRSRLVMSIMLMRLRRTLLLTQPDLIGIQNEF